MSKRLQAISHGTAAAVRQAIDGFVMWLQSFGTTSYDHQTFYSGPVGGVAKTLYYRHRVLGTAAVAPLVFCEAFTPGARRMLGKKLRFPIADAHYAMGFALLSQGRGDLNHCFAVTFLKSLEASRSPGYERFCWGYPFDWVTQGGTIKANSPFITSTPYAFEAFRAVYGLDRDERWRHICRSIAEHAALDIKDFPVSASAASAGYSPDDQKGGVVNAAAYRAWLLTAAAVDFADDRYWEIAKGNLNFVLEAQRPDGSWPYALDGSRDFVDHFHTCFVLKALAKIEMYRPQTCAKAIARGVDFYSTHLFDEDGLPKPFARAPRLTMYRRELYDYAECLNVCSLMSEVHPVLDRIRHAVLGDFLARWIKPDGSFRSRELLIGWDNVPMHRWAQSQMFRSLALIIQELPKAAPPVTVDPVASLVH